MKNSGQVMPKRLLKRLFPDPAIIRNHEALRFLGTRLHNPNLWHLNRRSVSTAFAVGLFTAFIPVPGQMLIAAIMALYFAANLPISVTLVWTTNPLTIGPMLYAAYITGAFFMQLPTDEMQFSLSLHGVKQGFEQSWRPILLGCLIIGTTSALASFIIIRVTWRILVAKKWGHRKLRPTMKKNKNLSSPKKD